MDEITTEDEIDLVEGAAQDTADEEANEEENKKILQQATTRFKQAYEAHRDDFEACQKVQDFIAGNQWPKDVLADRKNRPCLVLDHLNQYVRHVVNSGLMRARDVRVLAMSGEADDKVAEIIAGLIRQITQTSTSKVAYETGLRHACQVGFGYWRVKVQEVPKTKTQENPEGLLEIVVRKIKDPRMVLMDPFCEYPDGRDGHYAFVLTKLTQEEFKEQYPDATGAKSWKDMDSSQMLPWIGEGAMVVAEYYYKDPDGTMKWAVLCPDMVLSKGIHYGDVMPIIRVVGEEFENEGKERKRGMINESSMDAQRAYNYSSSAFIEAVALAPLAPWIAAEGQTEQYAAEWSEAHRVPRAVLRYTPKSVGGQPLPPPTRSQPAGIPDGWQGMMTNLISDTQMIMGLAQPSVLGTGGAPVQSGAGINAQQEPGEVNTFHFQEHWYMGIEQTGRVILAMIPHVYIRPQTLRIVGDDGTAQTAIIDPTMQQTMMEEKDAYDKVLSTAYNPCLGRYDSAISTGPSSATKKQEANKALQTVVNANPDIMRIAGDLVVGSMDVPGADQLAKRLRAQLPPGTTEEPTGQLVIIQQLQEQLQQLQQDNAEMEKIILAEREKAQAKIMDTNLKAQADLSMQKLEAHADLFKQKLDDDNALAIASRKAQNEIEINTQNNIVKIIIAKIQAKSKIDVEVIKSFSAASTEETHEGRMSGYMGVLGNLNEQEQDREMTESQAVPAVVAAQEPTPPVEKRRGWQVIRDEQGNMSHIIPVDLEEDDNNQEEVANG